MAQLFKILPAKCYPLHDAACIMINTFLTKFSEVYRLVYGETLIYQSWVLMKEGVD